MSIEVLKLIWDRAPYSGNKLITALALGEWADDLGVSWYRVEKIAKRSRQSIRNAQRCLRCMERDGFLSIEQRFDSSGDQTSNLYRINLAWLAERKSVTGAKRSNSRGDKMSPLGDPGVITRVTQVPPHNKEREPSSESSVNENHHACRATLTHWFSIKAKLKAQLPESEFKLWVRPMYLLRLAGDALLLALPPNGRIIEAAKANKNLLLEEIRRAGYSGCIFTRYPDAYERERVRKEYPELYEQMFGGAKSAGPAA